MTLHRPHGQIERFGDLPMAQLLVERELHHPTWDRLQPVELFRHHHAFRDVVPAGRRLGGCVGNERLLEPPPA